VQINADQLARHLERGLAPLYLVSGDEPLQVDECSKAIRRCAEAAGCSERSVFTAGPGFDWDGMRTTTQSLSLFTDRRFIELRLPTGRPGEAGLALLTDLAKNAPADIVLLVVTGKLDKTQRASPWVKAMETAGTHVVIWPLDAQKLPAWLTHRFTTRGLKPDTGVIDLLSWHLEGNMLAAAQEVDKLAMLCTDARVRLTDVEESLADSARFSIYQLVDAALAGEVVAVRRILASLHAEGSEPILILWALARELRALAQMGQELARGKPESSVLARAWAQRRTLIGKALRRHPASVWLDFVRRCAQLDRLLKGRASGDLWLEIERLLLAIAGLRQFAMNDSTLERSA
jgi:DNA polymerase-3 subunit delta